MDTAATDKLLTTTRSVRKRLDFSRPVPREVIEQCIDIALQAPSGSNMQGWSFVVVTDQAKRKAIADFYSQTFTAYAASAQREYPGDDPRAAQQPRVRDSAQYLADHMHEAPVLVIPCIEGRPTGPGQAGFWGSILPAAWSFMLALRSRGLGTAWTTLHLAHEKEISALLGIPEHVSQAVLFPVAYYSGNDFKPATRISAKQLTHWDRW
jgi:nitroreductase